MVVGENSWILPSGQMFRWLEFNPVDSGEVVRVLKVVDVEAYRVAELKVHSPEAVGKIFEGVPIQKRPSGCVFVPVSFENVLTASAKNAVGKVTDEYMKKVADLPSVNLKFEAKKDVPKTEKSWVAALARKICPTLSDEDITAICNLRQDRAFSGRGQVGLAGGCPGR